MQHSVFRFGLIGWLYLCLAGRMLSAFPLIPTKFPDDATLWREFADALGKKYQEGFNSLKKIHIGGEESRRHF